MKHLTARQNRYWEQYLATLPAHVRPLNPFVTAGMAGNRDISDDLLRLYLEGKKTAGSSLVEDFISAGDPLPQVGNFWIFLNSQELPSCILKTIKLETHKFKDIPPSIAMAEGEGDLSLSYWKRVHGELYTPYLAQWGIQRLDDATVITEFFEIVFRSKELEGQSGHE